MTKLLIADNQPIYRQGLLALLNKSSEFQVLGEASEESELMRKIENFKPDVVIMDMYLKTACATGVIYEIQHEYPDVKVLILSTSESEEDLFRVLKAGASAYVLKTASFSELTRSIRSVAEGESVLSTSMVRKLIEGFRHQTNNEKRPYNLSAREIEILSMAAKGDCNKEIARKCYISETTVKAHFRNILGKMEVKNRTGAVALATTQGIIRRITADSVSEECLVTR